jgi:hypothetical protein
MLYPMVLQNLCEEIALCWEQNILHQVVNYFKMWFILAVSFWVNFLFHTDRIFRKSVYCAPLTLYLFFFFLFYCHALKGLSLLQDYLKILYSRLFMVSLFLKTCLFVLAVLGFKCRALSLLGKCPTISGTPALHLKILNLCGVLMAHTYNHSYSGGRDQDCGS